MTQYNYTENLYGITFSEGNTEPIFTLFRRSKELRSLEYPTRYVFDYSIICTTTALFFHISIPNFFWKETDLNIEIDCSNVHVHIVA